MFYTSACAGIGQDRFAHHNTRNRVIVDIPRNDKLVSTPALGRLQPLAICSMNQTSLAKDIALARLKTDVWSNITLMSLSCETWLKKQHTDDSLNISCYKLTRLGRVKRLGGGVCCCVKQLTIVKRLSRRLCQNPTTGFFGWQSNLPAVTNRYAVCAVTFVSRCMTLTHLLTVKQLTFKEIVTLKPGGIICLVGDLNHLKTDTFEIEWGT